jgi:hypothetical protein
MDPAEFETLSTLAMAPVGAAFQWVRQYRSVPEWAYRVSAFVLGGVWYVVVHYPWTSDWRAELLKAIVGIATNGLVFMGGTMPMAHAGRTGTSILGIKPPAADSQP